MLSLLVALTRFLNHLFAAPIMALLTHLGVHVDNPAAPINRTLTLELIVMVLFLLFFVIVRSRLHAERPGSAQLMAESVHDFVTNQAEAIMGHGYAPHLPYVTTIMMFVLCCNICGLFPGIPTPTANPVMPLALALLTFAYYNWTGIRTQGPIGYIKHFAGPIWWISWLIFPIEIISHLARILSLTIRLYANMFASDLLTLAFFSMVPILVPAVFLGLHLFVALIQAYVFMLLTLIYLSQAVTHDDAAAH